MTCFTSVAAALALDRTTIPHWAVMSAESSDLPSDRVLALAAASDGGVWVGTAGGLARFVAPDISAKVTLIGDIATVTQANHMFAARAFDPLFLTRPEMFRFEWLLERQGWLRTDSSNPLVQRSPWYEAQSLTDGDYRVSVVAIDRYGNRSAPADARFTVILPKTDPWRERLQAAGTAAAGVVALYALALPLLLPFYRRWSMARTAVNSGLFDRFPLLHRTILDTSWARRRLFSEALERAESMALPKHYVPQALIPGSVGAVDPVLLNDAGTALAALQAGHVPALVLGRSGTGKSVLLRWLGREVAQQGNLVPLLVDLRTSPVEGAFEGILKNAIRGQGVELRDGVLDFLLEKGGFLILLDSLNEVADPRTLAAVNAFLNRNRANTVVIASQLDLLERPDIAIFRLAEVTDDQAADYLRRVLGREIWPELPAPARALARNPQDLALLGEILAGLAGQPVPTQRAELYRAILERDGALADWLAEGDQRLRTLYALAFRMLGERRTLPGDALRDWLAEAWIKVAASGAAPVDELATAIDASRLFREEEEERDVLGMRRKVVGFRHELVGKFLASRHLRATVERPDRDPEVDWRALAGDPQWSDVWFFVVDESHSPTLLNRWLGELLDDGGPVRGRVVAYALGTKPGAEIRGEIRAGYSRLKLDEDLRLTPAA